MSDPMELTLAQLLMHFDAVIRRHAVGIMKRLAQLLSEAVIKP